MFIKQFTPAYYHHSERDAIRLFADGYMVVLNLDCLLEISDGLYTIEFSGVKDCISVGVDFAPFEYHQFKEKIGIRLDGSQGAQIEGFIAFPLRPEAPVKGEVLCAKLKVRRYRALWYQPGIGMTSCEFTPMDYLETGTKHEKLLESYLRENMNELVKMEVSDTVSFTVDPEDKRTKGIIIRVF